MSNTSTAQIMSLVERYRTFGWLAKKPELKQQLQAAVETLVQERNELKAQIGDLPEAQKEMLKEIKSLKELLFKEQEKAVCTICFFVPFLLLQRVILKMLHDFLKSSIRLLP